MSSSLLFQQCPACLVRLTWIVFVMGGKWPYNWCLVWVLLPGLVQYCSQQSTKKTSTCRIVDFTISVDHRVKLTEIEKKDKYLDLARK